MKVIFLDIDGVLNCRRTPNSRKFPYIVDRKLLARLKRLLRRTGAKIVLTSSWRLDPIGRLAAKHFGIPCIGWLPDLPKRPRRDEILKWLANHPKVSRYVVIDDEDDEPSCRCSNLHLETAFRRPSFEAYRTIWPDEEQRICAAVCLFGCCRMLKRQFRAITIDRTYLRERDEYPADSWTKVLRDYAGQDRG